MKCLLIATCSDCTHEIDDYSLDENNTGYAYCKLSRRIFSDGDTDPPVWCELKEAREDQR